MAAVATYTIWSSGGRHEWLARDEKGDIVARSGLVFTSRSGAMSALRRYLREIQP